MMWLQENMTSRRVPSNISISTVLTTRWQYGLLLSLDSFYYTKVFAVLFRSSATIVVFFAMKCLHCLCLLCIRITTAGGALSTISMTTFMNSGDIRYVSFTDQLAKLIEQSVNSCRCVYSGAGSSMTSREAAISI